MDRHTVWCLLSRVPNWDSGYINTGPSHRVNSQFWTSIVANQRSGAARGVTWVVQSAVQFASKPKGNTPRVRRQSCRVGTLANGLLFTLDCSCYWHAAVWVHPHCVVGLRSHCVQPASVVCVHTLASSLYTWPAPPKLGAGELVAC